MDFLRSIPVSRYSDAYVSDESLTQLYGVRTFEDIKRSPQYTQATRAAMMETQLPLDVLIDAEKPDNTWVHPALYRALSDAIGRTPVTCAAVASDSELRVRADGFIHCGHLMKVLRKTQFGDVRRSPFFEPTVRAVAQRISKPAESLIDTSVKSRGAWIQPDLHAALLAAGQAHMNRSANTMAAAEAAVDSFRGGSAKRHHDETTDGSDDDSERRRTIKNLKFVEEVRAVRARIADNERNAIRQRYKQTIECYRMVLDESKSLDTAVRAQYEAILSQAPVQMARELASVVKEYETSTDRQLLAIRFDGADDQEERKTQLTIEAPRIQPMMSVVDYAALRRGKALDSRAGGIIGSAVAAHYRKQFQCAPEKQERKGSADLGMHKVAVYKESFWPIIDQEIDNYIAAQGKRARG